MHSSELFMGFVCLLNGRAGLNCAVSAVFLVILLQQNTKEKKKIISRTNTATEKSSYHKYTCDSNVTLKYQAYIIFLTDTNGA